MTAERTQDRTVLLIVGVPALFLLVFFVAPNALLLTASASKSDAQVMTSQLTTANYRFIFGRPLYLRAVLRTFWIGAAGFCRGKPLVVI